MVIPLEEMPLLPDTAERATQAKLLIECMQILAGGAGQRIGDWLRSGIERSLANGQAECCSPCLWHDLTATDAAKSSRSIKFHILLYAFRAFYHGIKKDGKIASINDCILAHDFRQHLRM